MQDRREFFHSLIVGGASVSKRPQNHTRHTDQTIYHGPMLVPERIADIVAEHPAIKRTNRSNHLVSRYAEAGWIWLFRCQIPEHRKMVGEIVKTPAGAVRVHCWSAADPERYTCDDEPGEILVRKSAPQLNAPLTPDTWWQTDAEVMAEALGYSERIA